MKVKTSMRRLKNAQISFISLVSRGANRIPFRVIKSEGENQMLDLTQLRHVFKSEAAPSKPTGKGYAHILKADPFRASKATQKPTPVVKAAPVQSIAKPAQPQQQQRQQVAEERQRQQLAPNQPLHNTPAPRRAGNVPKQPAPARDSVSLQSLKTEIDSALAAQRKREKEDSWNEGRSAFSQIAPTQPHHTAGGGSGNAHALRMQGGALAVQLLAGTDKPLPTNTAFRPYSAAGTKA